MRRIASNRSAHFVLGRSIHVGDHLCLESLAARESRAPVCFDTLRGCTPLCHLLLILIFRARDTKGYTPSKYRHKGGHCFSRTVRFSRHGLSSVSIQRPSTRFGLPLYAILHVFTTVPPNSLTTCGLSPTRTAAAAAKVVLLNTKHSYLAAIPFLCMMSIDHTTDRTHTWCLECFF